MKSNEEDQDGLSRELADITFACVNESPVVLWVKDDQFRYRFVNEAFSSFFDVDINTFLGSDDFELLPEAVARELRANDQRVLETQCSLRTIEEVGGAAGEVRRWLVHKFPVHLRDGQCWVGGSAADLTEWLTAKDELRRSEENHRRLVEASPMCIHQIDFDGRIISMNEAGLQMLGGVELEDVLGRHLLDFGTEEYRDQIAALLRQAFAGNGSSYEFESENGRFFRSRLVPIFDSNNRASSVLGITEDFTEQKLADDRIRASEERHRLVAMAARDPIWEMDLITGDILWNENYDTMFGIRPQETNDSAEWWTSRINAEDRERVAASLDAAINDPTAELWAEDYRFRGRDGKELFIQDRAFISRDEDGKALRIIGTMRDQTSVVKAMDERQKLLADVQEAQRLESLGVLAGGIAHDFNNLLAAMLGNISLLQLSNEADSEIVCELESAVDKAAEVCRQMLAYAGRAPFEVRPLRLGSLVQDMSKLLEVSIGKNVRLESDLHENTSPVVGDEAQLSQLIMNLVLNAAEAHGEGSGQVAVRVYQSTKLESPAYRIEPKPADAYVCLEVQDHGAGMTEETRRKMFDPFFTTKFTGRGMGLAAVQGIIRGHDAGLIVTSRPGKGTVIRVMFPAAVEVVERGQHEDLNVRNESGHGKSILIVEDEEQVRLALSRILDKYGFETESACNGLEALERIEQNTKHFDLVLLDLTMPKMGGVETLRCLRESNARLPIVLMSGYGEEDCVDRFVGERPDGYIKKPFTAARLLEALLKTLSIRTGDPASP